MAEHFQFAPSKLHDSTVKRISGTGLPVPAIGSYDAESLIDEWEAVKKRHGGLGEVPFVELSRYLDMWSNLATTARVVEAIAQSDLTTAEFNEKFVKKQLYLEKSGNREQRDAEVYVDSGYREVAEKYLSTFRMYEYIHALRDSYERYAFVISREISRRTSNMPQEMRQ